MGRFRGLTRSQRLLVVVVAVVAIGAISLGAYAVVPPVWHRISRASPAASPATSPRPRLTSPAPSATPLTGPSASAQPTPSVAPSPTRAGSASPTPRHSPTPASTCPPNALCATPRVTASPTTGGGSSTLTDASNGTSITVARGSQVSVVLNSTYWSIAEPSNASVLVAQGSQQAAPGGPGCPKIPGSGCGTVSRSFLAQSAGTATLSASRSSCGEAMACSPAQSTWRATVVVR